MLRKLGGKHDLHTCRRRGQRKREKEEERASQGRLNGIHVAVTSLEGNGILAPFILLFEMLIRLLATV